VANNKNKENDIFGKSISCPSLSQTSEPFLPQMAVPDEPNALDTDIVPTMVNDDSKGSSVEILDSGSDAEICEENELTKFSRMLCDAQKKALAKEEARGNKRKTYKKVSLTTVYRRKRCRRELAIKGFPSIDKFFELKEPPENAEELTAPQDLIFEELEESSDDDAVAVSWLQRNDIRTSDAGDNRASDAGDVCTSNANDIHTSGAGDVRASSASDVRASDADDVCASDAGDICASDPGDVHASDAGGVCASNTGTILEEVAPAVNEDCCQVVQGPAASKNCHNAAGGPAADHRRIAQGPAVSESCCDVASRECCQAQGSVESEQRRRAIRGLPEEEEESSGSEGEDRGTMHDNILPVLTQNENRQNVARKNGTYLAIAPFPNQV